MVIKLRAKMLFQNIIGDGDVLPDLPERFRKPWLRERFVVPIIFTLALLLISITTIISFVLNIGDNLIFASTSLICGSAFSIWTGIYWHFLINRKRFYSLFEDVEDIVFERMRLHVNDVIYTKTENDVQLYLNICSYVLFVPIVVSLSPFVVAAYDWCLGVYTIDSWFLFFPMWFPFEVNTAERCALLILWHTFSSFCCVKVIISTAAMFIELTLYTAAFLRDIKLTFTQMDRLTKTKNPEGSMLDHFKAAVILHERMNRCMSQTAVITNFMVLTIVAPMMMCNCDCLFILEKHLGTTSLHDLLMPAFGALFSFWILFMLFYVGQKLHSNLLELNDAIYQSEWYRYPPSVRRFMLLMMMRAQQPFHISAYGIMICNLENFVGVVKWIYSALTLLRTLE